VATTYVYASTSIDVPVKLSLAQLGPHDLNSAKLDRSDLPAKSGSTLQIAEIPRVLDSFLYSLDLPFALVRPSGPEYLASLQVLIHGHDFGSMIWWRWRTAAAMNGDWVTDHDRHDVICPQTQTRYTFAVQGVGTVGYDDINVTLELA
jgi:hypothetical protein